MNPELTDDVTAMEGFIALPRDNGELTFKEPWEGRAFALAIAVVDELDLPWDAFRLRLIDAIAEQPERPYYESWAAALESLVVSLDLATGAALDAATPSERPIL